MQLNDVHSMVASVHREEMLREADHQRLVRAAEQSMPHYHTIVCRVGMWIGDQLVTWGVALQRHGVAEPGFALPATCTCLSGASHE